MERSESSRITRDKQKPPIAAKPSIDLKILNPKLGKTFNSLRGSQEKYSKASENRRCESLSHEFVVETNNKDSMTDCAISNSLEILDSKFRVNPINDKFETFDPLRKDLDSPERGNSTDRIKIIHENVDKEDALLLTVDFVDVDVNVDVEKSLDTNGNIYHNKDDSMSASNDVKQKGEMCSYRVKPHHHGDKEKSEMINNVSAITFESNGNIEFESEVALGLELSNAFVRPIKVIHENLCNPEDSDDNGNVQQRSIPSSIPDILSDHVISNLNPPTDTDSFIPSSSNNDQAGEDHRANTPTDHEDPAGYVSREEGDDNDDGEDELVDLHSRRAILRGHSIRISHSMNRRQPSRLPSVVDSNQHNNNNSASSDATASNPHNSNTSSDSTISNTHNRSNTSSDATTSNPKLKNYLPKGWESRIDIHGRVFYIDHTNRCTTWKKPETPLTTTTPRISTITEEDRRIMDRRYQSLRRSLRARAHDSHDNPINVDNNHETTSDHHHGFLPRIDDDSIHPGAAFLSRPDFFTLLQNNQEATGDYNKNTSLKHMINKIRRDYSAFKQLQNRKDLVTFVNHFAEPNRPLPSNWQMKTDGSNKSYYIDHSLKVTTYIDPRLPPPPQFHADVLRGTNRSSHQPLQEPREGQLEYHDKVVSFLRQSNILDVLKSKYPAILSSMSLKNKVNTVRSEGQQAILKLKNDLELTVMLSIFEEEIMTYVEPDGAPESQFGGMKPHSQSGHHRSTQKKRCLDLKLNEFYARLEDRGFCKGNIKYRLIVRRDRILQDGYDKIMSLTKKELQRSKLVIAFKGEDGLDYGGPSREFFFLLSRELFNPYYGLFAYSANDTYTVQVSSASSQIENYLGWFRFAGRIIALSLVHQYLLDVFFTRVFYKQLLHLKPCLNDLESLDLEFFRSLTWINDEATGEELENMCLTFSVTEEVEDDEGGFGDFMDEDFKREGRKGLFGWFDGFVKNRAYSEQRRSKSNPRNRPLGAISALNINSASALLDHSNNLSSRWISAQIESTERNSANLASISIPNLVTAESQSTECLSNTTSLVKHHVPRIIERELKPNGKSIAVTERNRKEYVERMTNWRVRRGTQRQMEALIHGFNEILEHKLISRFDAHELELIIAGSVEIDVYDWRSNAVYRSGYSDNHQVISWFWNVVTSYDNNQRLRLLQFVTGTSSIPVEGFSALRGSTGPKKFCIEKWGKVTDLPRAHTCFNRLDLPPYTSYDILLEKLTIAVEETSTFGIE